MVDSTSSFFSKEDVRLLCASISTNKTFLPKLARIEPTLAVVVVLPTPPLWLANEMIVAWCVISYKFIFLTCHDTVIIYISDCWYFPLTSCRYFYFIKKSRISNK